MKSKVIATTIKRNATWLVIIILLVALVLVSQPTLTSSAQSTPLLEPTPAGMPEVAAGAPPADALVALEGRLERIYDDVSPSVVNIQVVQKTEAAFQGFPDLPGFRFFEPQTPQGPQDFYHRGSGSGFVWDKEGHIITNNHVVADADKISITFQDGSTVPGKVVGTDPDSDLAAVKVDVPADRLQPVQLTDSTQVKVGQLAIAIGNPFGLQDTMTVGFVSSLGRLLPVESGNEPGPGFSIPDVIQTDAAINPGNSGGVLVNDTGQVMGVTSAIVSPVRASAGIGFAIPSAIVQNVVPSLIEKGTYEHTWLGISGTSLNPDLAKAMGLKADQRGALVVDVIPDGPGDKAGLRGSDRQVEVDGQQLRVGGDVIVAIDGTPVKAFDDIVTYLARSTQVDQQVTMTVLRQGKQETIKATLAARPETEKQGKRPAETTKSGGAWLGIVGGAITPEVAKAMNLPADQEGVLIEQVDVGGSADQAGLRGSYKPIVVEGQRLLVGGDIITAFNGKTVTQMRELQDLIQQAEPDQKVTLTIIHDGEQIEVAVTLGQRPNTGP